MTDSALKMRIQEDRKNAMRNQDKRRLGAIQLIMAAIKQYEVDERKEMTDEQLSVILNKMLKQRRDSIAAYEKAQRQDLVDQETFEVNLIKEYLPDALGEAEISQMVNSAITAAAAKSPQDMGKVMTVLKPLIQGRADMTAVSALVKQRLSPSS